MFRTLFAGIVAALFSFSVVFAEEGDSIIVMDASGSMWGQIDGEAKITIAKSVMGDLLKDLPAERRLGLIAYGHRRKGDCADIEEVASVGSGRDAIGAAVEGLSPKGKTPMADSVKLAAEKLKSTEEKATVILVSDGIETCEPDPCGVAAALEQAGVDFTIHVVGFDVTEENAEAQLRCFADNTGGKYVSASNADELGEALAETVAAAPEPVFETKVRLRATELEGGVVIEEGLNWTVKERQSGEVVATQENAGEIDIEIAPGAYDVAVERPSDGLKGQQERIVIRENTWKTVTIALTFPVEATVSPDPAEITAGDNLLVHWTGPDRKGDWVSLSKKGDDDGQYQTYQYTKRGDPAEMRAPVEPGDYEVRYMLGRPIRVLARADLSVTEASATLSAQETALAGEVVSVEFTGPGGSGDWITIVAPDAPDNKHTRYHYTKQGSPGELRMPLEPGDYELRFVQGNKKVLARRAITITAVEAMIAGPATAVAGAEVEVEFTGPGGSGDWITVVPPDAPDNKHDGYHYTKQGSPGSLRMPLEPGEYELRFIQGNKKVLARQPITVTAATATLSAKDSAIAGETISVEFAGPAPASGDWITVVPPDAPDNKFTKYHYSKQGSPGDLRMPLEAGDYELRFVQRNRKVLARRPITVTPASATLDGPRSVAAGSYAKIVFTGPPAGSGDYIAISKMGSDDLKYESYTTSKAGSPANLRIPKEAGDYELRFVHGNKYVLARQPITVTPGE